jgi:hypothetical protein
MRLSTRHGLRDLVAEDEVEYRGWKGSKRITEDALRRCEHQAVTFSCLLVGSNITFESAPGSFGEGQKR